MRRWRVQNSQRTLTFTAYHAVLELLWLNEVLHLRTESSSDELNLRLLEVRRISCLISRKPGGPDRCVKTLCPKEGVMFWSLRKMLTTGTGWPQMTMQSNGVSWFSLTASVNLKVCLSNLALSMLCVVVRRLLDKDTSGPLRRIDFTGTEMIYEIILIGVF